MDSEGYEQWQRDNPNPDEGDYEVAFQRFFRLRDDMCRDDFMVGNDPLNTGPNDSDSDNNIQP